MDRLQQLRLRHYIGLERDACAIYAAISKRPASSGDVPLWATGLEALDRMDHRAGWVDDRSDGTGILLDIPRDVWQRRLEAAGSSYSAGDPRFWLLSLVVPVAERRQTRLKAREVLSRYGFEWILSHVELTDGPSALDSHALWYGGDLDGQNTQGYLALQDLEAEFPGRIAAFSADHAILKMTLSSDALRHHIEEEWGGATFQPRAVIGHNRFSTNTSTDLARVQPFIGLAHNGEINTIERLQREMEAHGIRPIPEGSDSQNLDRLLTALSWRDGLTHAEAGRLAVSPSPAILAKLNEEDQATWNVLQAIWGPAVEGPAAIIHRQGNSIVAGVDALGLRPLWLIETADHFVLSSEPGIVPTELWIQEPHSFGPGEVLAIEWDEHGPAHVVRSEEIFDRLRARVHRVRPAKSLPLDHGHVESGIYPNWQLVADGWHRDDQAIVKSWSEGGHEPIGSLGYDGPLAPFNHGITTIADYLQETVAVVTNPALDREREGEHFRLRTILGNRPTWQGPAIGPEPLWLEHPWLTDSDLATIKDHFEGRATTLRLQWTKGTEELKAATQLAQKARDLVAGGTHLLILDDRDTYQADTSVSLDPALAVSAIDLLLTQQGLRRQVGIVVRSGMIRHLHDAAVLMGLGANALVPYLIWDLVEPDKLTATMNVMSSGLEKIISTMGVHELFGYGRIFSAIGLPGPVSETMGIQSFAQGPYEAFKEHRQEILTQRLALIDESAKPKPVSRSTTYIYKAAIGLASGSVTPMEYLERTRAVEEKHPVALRHTIGFKSNRSPHQDPVSLAVGDHDLPFVISSMSFGSQGEISFRAYAEAARQLNMLSMNGEGGEIPDMIGRYYPWRGHQIASGRFGVNTKLLNGAGYAEIKIGQGAKPGEGGHLPGKKVSEKVARARNSVPGVDLISPSNNHDLYSIEDLKQLIDELKQANPDLKVIVKVPVVPNIGTIAVGIAKTGADVITLSGFEGGTGAARQHALRHVGLPVDIGLPLTHAALILAGLRDRVEVWCDGGMRSADDVVRMVLLGANRIGFGTMAMTALGCTICRSCQTDTCHVGITTQIQSVEEAHERGIKHFKMQESEIAVEHLVRFFQGMAEGVKENIRGLGFHRLSDAVGQWHLIQQNRFVDAVGYESFIQDIAEAVDQVIEAESVQAVGGFQESGMVAKVHRSPAVQSGRTIGTHLSGQRIRQGLPASGVNPVQKVAGQGFGAFLSDGVTLIAVGGAQDGVGKGAMGGTLAVLKGDNGHGQCFGGHVGKSLAYGAQGGTFIVQGGADARAGIRLAGADVVILGDGIPTPAESKTLWGSATIKGFGFEYMTRGRGLLLGDPGPWLASGMTGGVLYLRVSPEDGLSQSFHASRLASQAKVTLTSCDEADCQSIRELLAPVIEMYEMNGQTDRIGFIEELRKNPSQNFIKLVPQAAQTDPSISTE